MVAMISLVTDLKPQWTCQNLEPFSEWTHHMEVQGLLQLPVIYYLFAKVNQTNKYWNNKTSSVLYDKEQTFLYCSKTSPTTTNQNDIQKKWSIRLSAVKCNILQNFYPVTLLTQLSFILYYYRYKAIVLTQLYLTVIFLFLNQEWDRAPWGFMDISASLFFLLIVWFAKSK